MPVIHIREKERLLFDKDDIFYMSLDCIEQIAYMLMKVNQLDCQYVFLKLIYPSFFTKDDNWALMPPNKTYENKYFKTVDDELDNRIEEKLCSLISRNKYIAIHTDFVRLPYYDERELKAMERKHYTLLTGIDEAYFYFFDNVNIVKKSDGGNIRIGKKCFLDILNEKCELLEFVIDQTAIIRMDKKEVLSVYNNEVTCCSSSILQDWTKIEGIKTISCLYKNILLGNYDAKSNSFLSSHFNAHLLASTRRILMICMNEIGINDGECIELLASCIKNWDYLKMLIAKNNYSPMCNFNLKLQRAFKKIYLDENQLYVVLMKMKEGQICIK